MPAPDDVLRAAGEHAMAATHKMFDDVAMRETQAAAGVSDDDWHTALVELRAQGLVQMRDYDGRVAPMAMTPAGVWAYLTRFRPDVPDLTERLLDLLDQVEPNVAVALGADLGESPLLVEALLDQLARRRMVVYSRVGRDSFRIHRFTP